MDIPALVFCLFHQEFSGLSYHLYFSPLLCPHPSLTFCGCLVTKLCLTFATPWMVAHQAPLSMGFPRQEYWNGFPFPPPGNLPDAGIKPTSPVSPALQVGSLPLSYLESLPWTSPRAQFTSLHFIQIFPNLLYTAFWLFLYTASSRQTTEASLPS